MATRKKATQTPLSSSKPGVSERLKNARWVLRVQVETVGGMAPASVATCESPHATKDALRKVYGKAREMVRNGEALYAAALDRWATPQELSQEGKRIT